MKFILHAIWESGDVVKLGFATACDRGFAAITLSRIPGVMLCFEEVE